jgi:hypothetical protein
VRNASKNQGASGDFYCIQNLTKNVYSPNVFHLQL